MAEEVKCRICGCTETAPCPADGSGCAWTEPNLCTVCDWFIDELAVTIDQFTAMTAAHDGPAREHNPRYTAAVNAALSEASGRLRAYHAPEPLIEVPQPLIEVVRG